MLPSSLSALLLRTSRKPQKQVESKALELPTEIYHIIFDKLLNDLSLFAVGSTCRTLSILVADYVLGNNKFDHQSEDISLGTRDLSLLRALALPVTPVTRSVNRLEFDVRIKFKEWITPPMNLSADEANIYAASAVLRFISKLSSLKELKLILERPASDRWDRIVTHILSQSIEKGCVDVSIRTLHDDKQGRSMTTMGATRHLLASVMPRTSQISRKDVPLNACHINTWAVHLSSSLPQLLNESNLTTLSFTNICNLSEWNRFLERLHLSRLTTFSFVGAPQAQHQSVSKTLSMFLARHPTITSLTFCDRQRHPAAADLAKGNGAAFLPNLSRLEVSEDILPLFSLSLPSLKSLSLHLVGNYAHASTLATLTIASSYTISSLELVCRAQENGQFEWYLLYHRGQLQDAPPDVFIEQDIRCVDLTIDAFSSSGAFSTTALNLFPEWLRYFPVLQILAFNAVCFPVNFDKDKFAKKIFSHCAPLNKFMVIGNRKEVIRTL